MSLSSPSRSGAPRLRLALALCAGAALGLAPADASADVFDLTLERLITRSATATFAEPTATDQVAYRTFASELGIALAPRFLTPSDTVGYNGFQFDLSYGFTTIGNNTCADGTGADKSACPWQYAVAGGSDGVGGRTPPPGMIHTLTVMARKGIWLPLPSFEIGAGATKVMQSDNIYAVQVYAKFALHEGFHNWPIPSFAIRGSGMRVMGASQMDLTIAQVDASLSKSFGLFGSVNLTPYLGAAATFIIARGQVLDTTPSIDAWKDGPSSMDLNNNTVFPTQDTIIRWRFFGGLRLVANVLVITVDYAVTPCGDWGASGCDDGHKHVAIADKASTQHSFSALVGFLF